ncbi:MAG: hypothetical protein LBO00_01530 [Zoogloeaceae bacterium]|jgi:hypothetical protein|nr:hypothetical protein [Zoogloeaceae bacterium]
MNHAAASQVNNPSWSADAQEVGPGSTVLAMLINIFAVLILSGLLILAYHHFYVAQTIPPRLVTLDVNEILELKQLESSLNLLKGGTGDKNALALYRDISDFAKTLETEVRRLQTECDCILIVRSAVIGSNRMDDLTAILKERVSLANLVKDDLVRELNALGGQTQPSFAPSLTSPALPSFAPAVPSNQAVPQSPGGAP